MLQKLIRNTDPLACLAMSMLAGTASAQRHYSVHILRMLAHHGRKPSGLVSGMWQVGDNERPCFPIGPESALSLCLGAFKG